ncbi:hypothetical protein ACH4SP_23395 [Streptomyces sp. NPDC021093]|uniref:hypothetical protein n=1 Tax=Streptomyces sp. NPDC021093 TaxID=3365112 RepID=UPI0037B04DB1
MRRTRSMIAALGATVAGAAVLVAPGVAQADTPASAQTAQVQIQGKYYFNTWRNAVSEKYRDVSHPMGNLWAGNNYFYCQAKGQAVYDGANNHNDWWALTDDDNGNKRVWVSATAFSKGGPWEPIPGLPRC